MHVYVQYSRKIGRRCYCYGHLQNHLWTLIESDPSLRKYNERVAAVPMVGSDAKVVRVRPSVVAVTDGGGVQVHAILDREDSAQDGGEVDRRSVIDSWANQNEFTTRFWSAKDFANIGVRLNNLKQLVKFVSLRDWTVAPVISRDIIEFLKHHRKTTVGAVLSALGDHDSDLVLRALADLILSGECHSDIDRHALSRASTLSAYDETCSKD